MPELYEMKAMDTAGRADGQVRGGVVDFLAFLAVLVFVGGLTLLVDRSGQLSARVAISAAVGLVAGCVTAWRRLCRPRPHRWRSGQAVYRGRRLTVVSAWGVEGQPVPAVELPTLTEAATPVTCYEEKQEPR